MEVWSNGRKVIGGGGDSSIKKGYCYFFVKFCSSCLFYLEFEFL